MKKERERLVLYRFLTTCGAQLGLTYDHFAACEEPDFLACTEHSTLGIEVSELRHKDPPSREPVPLRHQEGMHRRISHALVRLWQERGYPPVFCNLLLKTNCVPGKPQEEEFAQRLIDRMGSLLPLQRQRAEIRPEELWDCPVLGPFVQSVSLAPLLAPCKSHFEIVNAGFLPPLDPAIVMRRIEEKEPKRKAYLSKCSKIWLLLAHNFNVKERSTRFIPASHPAQHEFAFDRVFLVNVQKAQVEELRRCVGVDGPGV